MVFYGFGCLEMVLGDSGGFLRFAVLVDTVESVDLNLKEVDNRGKFVVSTNNDAKVPLKQMIEFLCNSKYKVSLKKSLGG